jgi:hypothetical protein
MLAIGVNSAAKGRRKVSCSVPFLVDLPRSTVSAPSPRLGTPDQSRSNLVAGWQTDERERRTREVEVAVSLISLRRLDEHGWWGSEASKARRGTRRAGCSAWRKPRRRWAGRRWQGARYAVLGGLCCGSLPVGGPGIAAARGLDFSLSTRDRVALSLALFFLMHLSQIPSRMPAREKKLRGACEILAHSAGPRSRVAEAGSFVAGKTSAHTASPSKTSQDKRRRVREAGRGAVRCHK